MRRWGVEMEQSMDMLVSGQQFRKLLEKRCEQLNEQYHVRFVEMDILSYLSRAGIHDTARDIMADLHISKAHISKSVENLKEKGFLILEEDAQDRRCIHLCITEKAKPLIRSFVAERQKFMEKLLAGVTDEEREVMIRVISKILGNLNREYEQHF
ncbi:MAG: MarR family winged helix-turn-helix transcriptional regulator [Eubacterium sp.]